MATPYHGRLPVIPDLRFEQSYLRSISAHIYVQPPQAVEGATGEPSGLISSDNSAEWKVFGGEGSKMTKGKGRETEGKFRLAASKQKRKDSQPALPTGPVSTKVIRIDWGGIAWVTMRDQVISPLLQGALWGVGSHFFRPMLTLVGAHLGAFFSSHLPKGEGLGVGWLRSWIRRLGVGTGFAPSAKR